MGVKALASILCHLLVGISLVSSQNCYSTGTFVTNSTYGKNRGLILASLPSNVSANDGFFTTTIGQDSNQVYAIGLCRGDSSDTDTCDRCLNSLIQSLIDKCPNQKEAFSWAGDQLCLVHYADRSFFGILEESYNDPEYLGDDLKSNLTQFDTVWKRLMDSVATKASMGSYRLKYATGEADLSAFQRIYALMQCTPDLSQKDCDTCLRDSVGSYERCCHGKEGGYVNNSNCLFMWDFKSFYVSNPATTASSLSPPPGSESGSPLSHPANSTITKEDGIILSRNLVIVAVSIIISVVIIGILAVVVLLKRTKNKKRDDQNDSGHEESLQFDFNAVKVATEKFSDRNMLGKGGFGTVYKGILQNGQEIAVKRLSGNSAQGQQEFINEVLLLAKLQHRNLVRLLGFSMEENERILIYEFLSNSSLDKFIFDPVKRLLLNLEKRYKIIEGIAKGLLYIHQDSQYRIIHRDLKAANILLDAAMNPKISDFGIAKLFIVDQTQADTSTIVGTHGYMAPEYAQYGQYSAKSDVYSFGVLVLEIISGEKINIFAHEKEGESLLTHAWKNWNEGTAMDLLDPILRDGSSSEIMRCIHLGLLCVQENIACRPSMASVVHMLSGYSIPMDPIPEPLRPGFSLDSIEEETMSESSKSKESKSGTVRISVNEASISEQDPR
ncbi:hypothetical protein PTKIN_Ptkin01aG0024500 [Pterospermum kingtungense]